MIVPPQNATYFLRKAEAQDEPFLLQLYMAYQTEAIKSWGWDAAQQQVFLEMQYRARNAGYATSYPEAVNNIICNLDSLAIGRLLMSSTRKALHIIDIALLPQHQRKGIGSQILSDLQKSCASEAKKISLQVPSDSVARKLYARLGFQLVDQDAIYAQMEWTG